MSCAEGSELAFLIVQAFAGGMPAALALLMAVEWRDPSEPLATWGHLLAGSVRFAALGAVPVGYLLWMLTLRSPRARS
jgi:hypothetical protein